MTWSAEPECGFLQAVADHDLTLQSRGAVIWVGGEPTFTDRFSNDAAWQFAALGGDKEARAGRLLAGLHQPGMAVLRTVGRQYSGEDQPRWSIGLYGRRDGEPVWEGPADPLLLPEVPTPDWSVVKDFWERLTWGLQGMGQAVSFVAPGELSLRIVFRRDGQMPRVALDQWPELGRSRCTRS